MSQERWDVDLKIMNGPMASLGTQVKRGPVVRIGTNPGPTGFRLSGYRGVDARHCVITIYSEGEATIAPVGTNQVRAAPHPHVDWANIDPIAGPEYINKGGAVHLGPVTRGCTIEFVGSRRVGAWTGGQMASEAARVDAAQISKHARQEVRKVGSTSGTIRNIAIKGAPIWILGCMGMMVVTSASVVGGVILFQAPKPLTLADLPDTQQRQFYEEVNVAASTLVAKRLPGFNGGFDYFIATPNAKHAQKVGGRQNIDAIKDPDEWDTNLLKHIVASFELHARSPAALKRMDKIKEDYNSVLFQMLQAKLPEVFAAIPYLESRYQPTATSKVCALGWWQFMPEYGPRAKQRYGMDFNVQNCNVVKPGQQPKLWTPSKTSPGPNQNAEEYVLLKPDGKPGCAIKNLAYGGAGVCQVDDRTKLDKTTALAIRDFEAPWSDTELAKSGAAIQSIIMSHNAGWDATLVGGSYKWFNIRHSYRSWRKAKPNVPSHKFYGDNLTCEKKTPIAECRKRSFILNRVQHYSYPIIAQHMLATCYYAVNHAKLSEQFTRYRDLFVGDGKYCNQMHIKTSKELGL